MTSTSFLAVPEPEVENDNYLSLALEQSDDEAPDDVSQAVAKDSFLKEVRQAKQQSKEEKQKKKELNKQKQAERAKKKKDKAPIPAALPQDLLDQVSKKEEEEKRLNIIKKFNDSDHDNEDEMEESVDEPVNRSRPMANFKVVAPKDHAKLNHVAESVLNFREKMMSRHKRESASEAMAKRAKLAQLGSAAYAHKY